MIYTEGSEKAITKKIIINGDGPTAYNFTTESEKFNWGYYDDATKKSIEDFQNYFKLPVDGTVGQNTLSKLIDVVKGEKCGVLQNKSGIEFTEKNENLMTDELIYNLKKDREEDLKEIEFDPENIKPEQQKQIDEIMDKYLLFDSQNSEEVFNKIESENY